jgi:hypothetical protein
MNRRKNRGPITAANKKQNLIWAPPFGIWNLDNFVVGRPDRLPPVDNTSACRITSVGSCRERQLRCHRCLADSTALRWRFIVGGWVGLPGARLARPPRNKNRASRCRGTEDLAIIRALSAVPAVLSECARTSSSLRARGVRHRLEMDVP